MKKLIPLIVLFLLLCGCNDKTHRYLITAIGIDYADGLYEVSFEALTVNREVEGQQTLILTASGKSLDEIMTKIKNQATEPLLLSHCGVVAVGNGVNNRRLFEIMNYCKADGDLTLSVKLLKTENADKLLKQSPVSSVCVGYDLLSMLDRKGFKNRLFELYTAENPILPIININETGYYFAKG